MCAPKRKGHNSADSSKLLYWTVNEKLGTTSEMWKSCNGSSGTQHVLMFWKANNRVSFYYSFDYLRSNFFLCIALKFLATSHLIVSILHLWMYSRSSCLSAPNFDQQWVTMRDVVPTRSRLPRGGEPEMPLPTKLGMVTMKSISYFHEAENF